MTWPNLESDLAPPVIAYLEDLKWDVYQEVQCATYGSTADLVARQRRIIWVIELKRRLSFEVVAQAAHWLRYAHYASVAVPEARRHWTKGRALAHEVLAWKGVGYIPVSDRSYSDPAVSDRSILPGRLNRKANAAHLRDALVPEQKTFAPAGSANGKRWTPFQRTCREVREAIAKKPGMHLKELVDKISHHYASEASARSSLSTWIQGGQVEGVEARRDGRYLRIYLKEKA